MHSAGVQDRDGAALVIDRIRHRFPWLELIWADGIYNAHQVDVAAAKVPCLRIEIVKRTDDVKGFAVLPGAVANCVEIRWRGLQMQWIVLQAARSMHGGMSFSGSVCQPSIFRIVI